MSATKLDQFTDGEYKVLRSSLTASGERHDITSKADDLDLKLRASLTVNGERQRYGSAGQRRVLGS